MASASVLTGWTGEAAWGSATGGRSRGKDVAPERRIRRAALDQRRDEPVAPARWWRCTRAGGNRPQSATKGRDVLVRLSSRRRNRPDGAQSARPSGPAGAIADEHRRCRRLGRQVHDLVARDTASRRRPSRNGPNRYSTIRLAGVSRRGVSRRRQGVHGAPAADSSTETRPSVPGTPKNDQFRGEFVFRFYPRPISGLLAPCQDFRSRALIDSPSPRPSD